MACSFARRYESCCPLAMGNTHRSATEPDPKPSSPKLRGMLIDDGAASKSVDHFDVLPNWAAQHSGAQALPLKA